MSPRPTSGFQSGGSQSVDIRYSRARTFLAGINTPDAVIACRSDTVTSTGATGPYTFVFAPVTFKTVPILVAFPSLDLTTGNFVVLSWSAVSATGFTLSMATMTPGLIVIPAGEQVVIDWIAIGL